GVGRARLLGPGRTLFAERRGALLVGAGMRRLRLVAARAAVIGSSGLRLGGQLGARSGCGAQLAIVAAIPSRDALAGDLLDVLQEAALVVGAEGHGGAAGPGARGAADAVDVGLRHV